MATFWSAMEHLIRIAIGREKKWCHMCSLGVFPGHGHQMRDGTKDEALIRWL